MVSDWPCDWHAFASDLSLCVCVCVCVRARVCVRLCVFVVDVTAFIVGDFYWSEFDSDENDWVSLVSGRIAFKHAERVGVGGGGHD